MPLLAPALMHTMVRVATASVSTSCHAEDGQFDESASASETLHEAIPQPYCNRLSPLAK